MAHPFEQQPQFAPSQVNLTQGLGRCVRLVSEQQAVPDLSTQGDSMLSDLWGLHKALRPEGYDDTGYPHSPATEADRVLRLSRKGFDVILLDEARYPFGSVAPYAGIRNAQPGDSSFSIVRLGAAMRNAGTSGELDKRPDLGPDCE